MRRSIKHMITGTLMAAALMIGAVHPATAAALQPAGSAQGVQGVPAGQPTTVGTGPAYGQFWGDGTAAGAKGNSSVQNNGNSSYTVNVYSTVDVTPIYCFYSAPVMDHFWTIGEQEKQQLELAYQQGRSTYQYIGVSGYALKNPGADGMPVYRFFNEKTQDHFYTVDEAEKKAVEANLKSGKDNYVYEGVAWYVPKSSGFPVYRFFHTVNFNHFYTSDPDVRAQLVDEYRSGAGSYRYEGIAWYWYE